MTPTPNRWPGVFALAVTFSVAALAAGLWLGGAFALGRRDLALAIPTLLAFAIPYVALCHRAQTARLVNFAAAMLVLLAAGCIVAGGPQPAQLLALCVGAAAALVLADVSLRRTAAWPRAFRWCALTASPILWWLFSHVLLAWAYTPSSPQKDGRTIIVSGLPLMSWSATGEAPGGAEDIALSALRAMTARPLVLADALPDRMLAPADRVLLAHPRALSPESLVEFDRFVRAGGRAVLLADGLSAWPPPHRFGDPRNPPVTSLLTPLLDHWGLALAAPDPTSVAAGQVRLSVGGARLLLHSAGHFDRVPPNCRQMAQLDERRPVVVSCRIGRGTAVLVADADLLFGPLWASAPGWARHLRPSDNIEWLAEQLNGDAGRAEWGLRPTWSEATPE